MEGVTVLNIIENPIMGFVWNGGAIFLLILMISVMCIGIAFSTIISDEGPFFVAILLNILLGLLLMAIGNEQIDSYPTYEVTITDEVSMAEFMERYEIVEQRGEIYEVKEREAQEEADSD